ncbi:MAG: hypothetical protein LQ350_000874 [Teloschistes chrysophthalmus]|nr:MAG: hypothetical protein LQ350_000874 [Niorma chrysophthalma]
MDQDRSARYKLTIRQQPLAARACGMGERDRRVIDPPPVVQLSLADFDPTSSADVDALRQPFNAVHCALIDCSGSDVTALQEPHDQQRTSRRLMGGLVVSPFVGTDPNVPNSQIENARLGCFFIFPDLSCRQTGLYRLRFTLMQLGAAITQQGSVANLTTSSVETNVFEVFSAKDFPGMKASTELIKELKRQGATVSVKKGNEGKADAKATQGSTTSSDNAV